MGATLVFDIIRGLALIVGVAAGTKYKVSDLLFTSWFAFGMFFFPNQVLGYQVTGKDANDGLMYFLVRCFAASQLAMMFFMWLTLKTNDTTVKGSILWARTLGCLPLLMIMVHGQVYHSKKFGHGNLWFILPLFVAVWLYNIYQMGIPPPVVGRREQKGPVSIICRLYFLVLLVAGLQAMVFPQTLLSFVTTSKKFLPEHFLRLFAVSDFSFIFLAWYAPSFLRDEDRKFFFISQLAGGLLEVVSLLSACFIDNVIQVSQLLGMFLFLIPLILPAVGLVLIVRKEKKQKEEFTSSYYTRSKSD